MAIFPCLKSLDEDDVIWYVRVDVALKLIELLSHSVLSQCGKWVC